MTPEDLAALHAACFTTPRPWSAKEFADLLTSPTVFLVTGEGPSFALGRAVAGEAELLTLAVAPEARGRSLGRLALQDYEAEARARGAEDAFLEVATDNTVAISLYLSEGYCESGRRKGYYAPPEGPKIDALVFTKRIKQT
ncbi:ribosomal-protein-alanine acetyltransferase [Celeribacter ethanolicus]|uniref:Ribosomal-protein-alanine acetyltransferase n=1 Tax=Celeribacter ethanolicus TaxID=1758178 RepID=A0A291GHD0_9RHOB|nr:ribosomal-protein-alanine acetyltransferase [Celeribacter ethanolicus]TNE67062.1 MAG: GNAT family N-acetyltransferase [Paracoccaceae bacterium]